MQQNKISLQDRYRGALVGVLCGDALGAPYETWPSVAIRQDIQHRRGLVLFDYDDPWEKDGRFPAGRPTDDSEMTAALAEHYVEEGNEADLYQKFRRCVVEKKSYLCDLPAYGFGGTTRKALAESTYLESLAELNYLQRIGKAIPSNGALMRAAPVALRYFRSTRSEMALQAVTQAMITHRHQAAIWTSVLYTFLMNDLLEGKEYEVAAHDVLAYYLSCGNEYNELTECIRVPAERPPIPKGFGGGALYTLTVANWAVASSFSFEEGMTKAIMIGRDVDTYGAVTGGLLGALYGIDAIPKHWQDKLLGRDHMVSLADALFERNQRT